MRLACLPLLAVALPALADPAADEAAVRQRLADWTAAFNARDAAGACDLFAPDLAYALPGLPDGTHEGMCANLAKVLARDDLRLHYEPPAIHDVMVSGDLAVVRLTWTLVAETGGEIETTSDEGLDVFRRQPDGRWSIVRYLAFPNEESGAFAR